MTMESSPDKENKQDSINLDDSGYRSPGSSIGSPSPNKTSLSRSTGTLALRASLSKSKLNFSSSCFADLCSVKDEGDGNDDLTSLSWLQENNLLKAITSSPTSVPLSPTRENKRVRNYQNTSFKDTVFWTSDDYAGEEEIDFVPKGDSQNCKPPYSFSSLIFMAIENSPSKCLPVKDIYSWIVEHFPYFRTAPLGWKNSVRHNLSLNKSFKKIEKDKNGVGKGSLWCIDTEYRPSLLQALRKMPAYNSLPFSSPPTSPGGSYNGGNSSYSNDARLPGIHSPSFDDAEFDAATTMCTISTPPELREKERERLRNRASTPAERSSPALLSYWRKYIEPFSDEETSSSREGSPAHENKENDGNSTSTARFNIEHLLADVGLRCSRRSLKRSADGIELSRLKCNGGTFLDEGVDNEYDLNNRSDEDIDDDISDDEINDNLRRLVERDTLGDSGYGGELGSVPLICDHTYVKVPKLTVKEENIDTPDTGVRRGLQFSEVDALLSLANAATQQLEEIRNRDN